mgnify:CR=1 FL=1
MALLAISPGLKFPKERISSFSIAKLDKENLLIDIIEKPNKSIINKSSPVVSFKDGFKALELAIKIINKVDGNS